MGRMSQAHLKLCDGQGAEMAWERRPTLELAPIDALQIYALKTSPAFEAALYSGLRMAGPMDEYEELVPLFCKRQESNQATQEIHNGLKKEEKDHIKQGVH